MSFKDTAPQAQGQMLAVQTILASAANWRQAMAKKYTHDIRNQHAAQSLQSLANEKPVLPEFLVAELSTCHGLGTAAKDTARRVGFSLFPASIIEFLHSVLVHLAEQQAEIDAAFPSTKREAARDLR